MNKEEEEKRKEIKTCKKMLPFDLTYGEPKFSNLGELKSCQTNPDDILNQNETSHITDISSASGLIASQARDDFACNDHSSQTMYQSILKQTPYQHHHLSSSSLLLNQPYENTTNQNPYIHSRNYDQKSDDNYFHYPQMFPQQQMQNQIYCSANSANSYHYTNYNSFNNSEMTGSTPNPNEPVEILAQNQSAHNVDTFSNSQMSNPRKRPHNSTDAIDYELETGEEVKIGRTSLQSKRNHSQIEKKRRDKMNTYIAELSTLIPMCHSMSRKLDKLTVLRMAIQHLKTIRRSVYSFTEGEYKPTFLSDKEHKMLILQRADGFLFVVGCDRGRFLYVSESVSEVLNYSQGELMGQSWFDILHPEDVGKIKEQLSSSDLPREKLIDARTMLPVKADYQQGLSLMCPGARRSFFCRMKCKSSTTTSKDTSNCFNNDMGRKKQMNSDKKYIVVHCTGYLKSWQSSKFTSDEQNETETKTDDYSCNLACLVAVGRILPTLSQRISSKFPDLEKLEFTSRHAIDGKFLFVDQSATLVLGFLPQELLGTSMYEYYEYEDISALAETHKKALKNNERITTSIYRFRTKEDGFVSLQSIWRTLKNPWTKEMEYLAAKNIVIFKNNFVSKENYSNTVTNTDGAIKTNNTFSGSQRAINTQVDAMKIGRQIAEQALEYHRRTLNYSSDGSPDPEDHLLSTLNTLPPPISLFADIPPDIDPVIALSPVRPRINGIAQPRINGVTGTSHNSDRELSRLMESSTIAETMGQGHTETTTNNDEAAMAVIMSLLEADAGLGGPVDFTGLPWPLP